MGKYIFVVILAVVFIAALINLVRIAKNKKSTSKQLVAVSLDVACLPSSLVIILWLLGVI